VFSWLAQLPARVLRQALLLCGLGFIVAPANLVISLAIGLPNSYQSLTAPCYLYDDRYRHAQATLARLGFVSSSPVLTCFNYLDRYVLSAVLTPFTERPRHQRRSAGRL